jgi:hypothetical protein
MLAPHQARLLRCDPSSLCLKPSSTSHLHGYLREDHLALLQLPWEVVGRCLVAAWAEVEGGRSLAALEEVVAVLHFVALVVEGVPHWSA